MRLHTGSKPFKCPHCDLRFRTSGHRKSHMAQHFKPNMRKRIKNASMISQTSDVAPPTQMPSAMASDVGELSATMDNNQIINIDQFLLQDPSGVLPFSISLTDDMGTVITDFASQVLQGINLENLQLHLTSNSGLQISGLDPTQSIPIDAAQLQHLQQGGNINLTINPNLIDQTLPQTIVIQEHRPNDTNNLQFTHAEEPSTDRQITSVAGIPSMNNLSSSMLSSIIPLDPTCINNSAIDHYHQQHEDDNQIVLFAHQSQDLMHSLSSDGNEDAADDMNDDDECLNTSGATARSVNDDALVGFTDVASYAFKLESDAKSVRLHECQVNSFKCILSV